MWTVPQSLIILISFLTHRETAVDTGGRLHVALAVVVARQLEPAWQEEVGGELHRVWVLQYNGIQFSLSLQNLESMRD